MDLVDNDSRVVDRVLVNLFSGGTAELLSKDFVEGFLEGLARQPELGPTLLARMFIVAALVDAVAFVGIAIALLLIFANPFLSQVKAAAAAAGVGQ